MEEIDDGQLVDLDRLVSASSTNSAPQPCLTCAGLTELSGNEVLPGYVYALGQISPRFPSLAVEKEFAQATGRAATSGMSDNEALQTALSQRENRYLLRQICWVMTIQGVETYVLSPRDPVDFDLLVESLRPAPDPSDVDVVVGIRGPLSSPDACNGLVLPAVLFDQIYSFDIDSLIEGIPRPGGVSAEQFEPTAREVFSRIMQVTDNAGAMDEHRALNYLAVRYPAIYARTSDAHSNDQSLSGVDVRPSRLSGVRSIVDAVFSYTGRETGVTESSFVRVDVTEEFPFLVTRLAPYFER